MPNAPVPSPIPPSPPPPAQPPKAPIHSIREVFGYLSRYKGQYFVLKLDDGLLDKPLFPLLVKDIVALQRLGIKIILVPGAKHSIDRVLKAYQVKSASQDDVRITSDEAMPLVKLGASNVTNALISLLAESGASGVVGNWVRARAMGVIAGVDFKNTGRVERVDVDLIRNLVDDSFIPILPNIGWSAVGKDYNLSSNELAVATARALRASKLFFVGTERGVPVAADCRFTAHSVRRSGVYSSLDLAQAGELLARCGRQLGPEHREIVALALEACRDGVDRVHVIDGSRDGKLLQEIFSSSGHGTMFYANHYANIRPATPDDIPEILRIMQPYVDAGVLVQRTPETLAADLEAYVVYKVDDVVQGCGALRPYPGSGMAELEALVVDKQYAGRGTGRRLVTFLVDRARASGLRSVFLLTTQTSDFFMRNGFREMPVSALPPERLSTYNTMRNSRVFAIALI